MRPSRKVLPKALALTLLAGLLAAGSAFAQYYDPALRSLDLGTDVQRSPRLLGMGGLSISVPDNHQRLTLWDFAGSPIGAFEADSSSTLELRPGSGSASGAHLGDAGREREDLAGRASGMAFEIFHRDAEGSAWGATGNLRSIRTDHLYSQSVETRRTVSDPEITPVITGPFPYWGKGKLRYAVRMEFAREQQQDVFRNTVSNGAGEFISLDGRTTNPPSAFDPLETTVRRMGIGGAASYPVGRSATLALGYDVIGNRIQGMNDGTKSSSEITEKRPYGIAQATLVGKLGKAFEYGIDDRRWTSSSQQNYFFTISGGVGAVPLQARGKMLERDETGNAFNGRARWTVGNLQFSGQYWTLMTRANYNPPGADDFTAFNLFLRTVYRRAGTDTLALPDSVVRNRVQDNAFGYAGGVSWKLERALVGLEYHWARNAHGETVSGAGPKTIAYDVRAGLEYRCSEIVTGRIGGGIVRRDPDDYMRNDEQAGESASLGLGLTPPRATWGFDLGWTMTWMQSDYPDPVVHRSSHQQVQTLLHWTF
jgi:hypothetical protein